MFYIHPDECINCGLCLSVCPVDAVAWDEEIAVGSQPFIAINREFFGKEVTGWGSPGGRDERWVSDKDHPAIVVHPQTA
jgi:ferredoxin